MAAQTYSGDMLQQQPEHRGHHASHGTVSLKASISAKPGTIRNVGVVKGDGELSYAKNSSSQAVAVQELISYIEDAVDITRLPNSAGPVVVADLGCASGSNTLKNIDIIVNRLKKRYLQSSCRQPDVSVYFNDLPSNDFNGLFQLVAEDTLTGYSSNTDAPAKYFPAGVPGSFYSRLFPESFVHVFFSSHCLHWLSKVPDAVMDRNSPAFNSNSCWIQDASEEVIAAYKDQSDKDLTDFLRCRAEELQSGGLLFLLFFARQTSHEILNNSLFGDFWRLLDLTLESLVSERILTEEQRSSFNIPTFARSMEEISEVIERFKSQFVVQKLEMLPIYHFADYFGRRCNNEEPKILAKKVLLMIRTTKEPLIEAHFGPALNKIFWERCTELLLSSDLVGKVYARVRKPEPLHQVLIALVRK
ncbi:hypothetical protein MPTK1_6g18160 [Marchantia polymorpha subsp. ruderalis]|uniref:Uncharacterized protein n=2 Tax=Marchantia polymorpha TaxID=3197 RepID=A0A176VYW0_MARPO|nr:hypothetical protein AXG93_2982s1030 [Marchantia polymorpha subsp. ruderalis]PTQ40666.1 hypothetical protein MARPO_0038s0025 [Marchantia polymorpha]BBN15234.1 hypothetical protein Mp_6g18160 [Marchantia polymorpha subsp. ruderalis]|eukprot:PTQ40666.1 hypothetical protein MARPO_0038s0025 [Marchantia polymorpha]